MSKERLTQVYGISPEELKETILLDVRKELQDLKKGFNTPEPTVYLTRKEVAKLLKVSLVTLSDWNKKGILKPYRLGNLIRYKRVEIDKALIRIRFRKELKPTISET